MIFQKLSQLCCKQRSFINVIKNSSTPELGKLRAACRYFFCSSSIFSEKIVDLRNVDYPGLFLLSPFPSEQQRTDNRQISDCSAPE